MLEYKMESVRPWGTTQTTYSVRSGKKIKLEYRKTNDKLFYLILILLDKIKLVIIMTITFKTILRSFLIGSSFFVTLWPYLYTGIPHILRGPIKGFRYEYMPIFVPIYYGVMNVLSVLVLKQYIRNDQLRMFVTGAITGLVLSLIGHFGFRLPEKLYKMDNPNMVHIVAPIIYSLIFGLILYNVDLYTR